jgi:hypothetical protein
MHYKPRLKADKHSEGARAEEQVRQNGAAEVTSATSQAFIPILKRPSFVIRTESTMAVDEWLSRVSDS